MKLGNAVLQQAGEDIGFARLYFLQQANAIEPEILQEVYNHVYPEFLKENDIGPILEGWCSRCNLMLENKSAEWVKTRAQWTLRWWKNGKPTEEQMLNGLTGERQPEPLEWCPMLPSFGLPAILPAEVPNPFECRFKYSLIPRDNETERSFLMRLKQEHDRNRAALLAAARDAFATRKLHLTETPSLPSFEDHVKWAVWFQVCNLEIDDILGRIHAEESTVRKGIDSVLGRIQLTPRRHTTELR